MTGLFPFLDGEVSYVNVSQTFGRTIGIAHFSGQFVVLTNGSGSELWEAKLGEDGSMLFGDFPRGYSNKEFCFSTASCSDGLFLER